MFRGPKEGIEGNSFSDGEFFVSGVRRFTDLCKDDRVVPSKRILKEIGATESSLVAWKIGDGSIFIYGIDPEKLEELDISEQDGMMILKQIDEDGKESGGINSSDIYIIQVKSQGRVGTRNQISEILKKAGISENDWLIPQFVNNKEDGTGWRLYGLKKENLLFSLNIKEEEGRKNATVSSA